MKINPEIVERELIEFIATLENFSEPHLVSFAFRIENFDLKKHLNQNQPKIFFFSKPSDQYSFLSTCSAIDLLPETSSNIFEAATSFEQWKRKLITNWSELHTGFAPIINFAAKFDSQRVTREWEDFQPIKICVPAFMFSVTEEDCFGFYNFLFDEKTSIPQIVNELENYLVAFNNSKIPSVNSHSAHIKDFIYDEVKEKEKWQKIFREAIKLVNKNESEKIVLSRCINFNLDEHPNWDIILETFEQRFPDCYLFTFKENNSYFFGASPEMFLKITGNLVEVESVAGSAPRGNELDDDKVLESVLQSSEKNHREHKLVTDFISEHLSRFANNIVISEEKQIRKLDNIQHLITKISGQLNSRKEILALINSLFPTPAVCGVPKEASFNFIKELEEHDRGLYSGLIGWMDFNGNCELAVAIRSALVKDKNVTAYAGAGIVSTSISEEEFKETKLKLKPILSLFNPEEANEK